jgi:4-amino-4-deoxy-L-arabinose transferase-like glycosyltransferase
LPDDASDIPPVTAPPPVVPLWSRWLLALLLILGVLGALRVGLLLASGTGLQLDEAQYWHWSRDLQWGYYSKPPVIAALIAASTALFGTSVLGVKALAMVCWLLIALLLFFFVREMVLDRLAATDTAAAAVANRAGFWAALLFTTTPVAGLLGMAVTTDAPLLLCWTLASWLLWRVLQARRWWGWAALGLVIGVGLLSKYTIAAWLPGAAVLAWLALRWRSLPGLLLAAGVALLVCLPHLAWNADWGWPTIHHTADITTAASRADDGGAGVSLGEFFAGQLLLIGPVLAIWLLVLAGWAGVTRLRGRPAPAAPVGSDSLAATLAPARHHLLWLALPLLTLGAAQAINARAQMNWTAPVVPLLCAWLALHLVAAGPARSKLRVSLALAGVAISLALTLFAAAAPTLAAALHRPWPARLDLYIRMRGWPEAYAQLRPQLLAHPGWPVMGVNRTVIAHGAWLWRDLDVDWSAWHEPGPPHDHYQLTIPYDRPRPSPRAALRGLTAPTAPLALPPPSPQASAPAASLPSAPMPGAPLATAGLAASPGDISSLGEPLLVLAEGALPDQIRGRLNSVKLLHKAEVQTAPGRVLTLTLWSARLPAVSPLPPQ